jgi:hypothetical protein
MSHHDNRTVKVIDRAGSIGFVFFLAYIGAAIYFIQQSTGGFWEVILALLKAIVWPVFVTYHVLQNLGV